VTPVVNHRMTVITVPEGVSFDAQPLMASMEDHPPASSRQPRIRTGYRFRRWSSIHKNCLPRVAGPSSGSLPFAPRRSTARGRQSQHLPELPGRAPAVTRRASVAILRGRGADLIFAVSVRRVLRKSRDEGYLSELLLAGSAAAAGLLVVAMAMQAAVAQRAEGLAADVAYTVGVHFVGVLLRPMGFMVAATAFAYAFGVLAYGVLPRWTAYLAVLSLVVDLIATAGVFFRTGAVLPGGRLLRLGLPSQSCSRTWARRSPCYERRASCTCRSPRRSWRRAFPHRRTCATSPGRSAAGSGTPGRSCSRCRAQRPDPPGPSAGTAPPAGPS
jgi:hypothetical protein